MALIMIVLMLATLVITAATQTWWMQWAWEQGLRTPAAIAGLFGITAVGIITIGIIGALTT